MPQGWDSCWRNNIMGFGKDGKGAIVKEQTTFSLGALAGQDLVGVDSAVLLDQDYRILRLDVTCVLTGVTSLEGQGLVLYMSQGIFTEQQVESNIEQNGPTRPGERVEEEIAERWVRRVGITIGSTVNETERVMRNKYGGGLLSLEPRWTFRRGRVAGEGGWNWNIYNDGVTVNTGITARVLATHYGVWVT